MCMQITLDRIPSKMFLFTISILLVIPFSKATNSASRGARLSISSLLSSPKARIEEKKRRAWFQPCIMCKFYPDFG